MKNTKNVRELGSWVGKSSHKSRSTSRMGLQHKFSDDTELVSTTLGYASKIQFLQVKM